MTEKLYEDRMIGIVSEDSFSVMLQKIEAERLEKETRHSLLYQSEEEAAVKSGNIQNWMRLIKEKSACQEVDRELLESLIDKIEVGECRVVNGVKERDIKVYYAGDAVERPFYYFFTVGGGKLRAAGSVSLFAWNLRVIYA